MECIDDAVNRLDTFYRSYNERSATLVQDYQKIEQELLDDGYDKVDIRLQLPLVIVDLLIQASDASISILKCQSGRKKVEKAASRWGLSSRQCIFVLDSSKAGRPFCQNLFDLANLCPHWPQVGFTLLHYASSRREGKINQPGVDKNASGLVLADVTAALQEVTGACSIFNGKATSDSVVLAGQDEEQAGYEDSDYEDSD
ncbi:hypothetical protein Brms1b_013687 [Colletotrichum noveboracense]|nr:hypothetical protein Brms1b_013687 [Colletotrichum noveboracense]